MVILWYLGCNLRIGHTCGDIVEPHVKPPQAFGLGERQLSAADGIDTEYILGQRHSRLGVNVVVPSRAKVSRSRKGLSELARITAPSRAVDTRSRLLTGRCAIVRIVRGIVLVSKDRFKDVYLFVQACRVHLSVGSVCVQCQLTQVEGAFQCAPRLRGLFSLSSRAKFYCTKTNMRHRLLPNSAYLCYSVWSLERFWCDQYLQWGKIVSLSKRLPHCSRQYLSKSDCDPSTLG